MPSIRWELLREGMEDYEYLWLLNGSDPQIGVSNQADTLASQFITSRTRFSQVPTDLYQTRAALAAQLTGPRAAKSSDKSLIAENEIFQYQLVYRAGDTGHAITISDSVPAATTVISASGSKSPVPTVAGQDVSWSVSLASQESVILTITAHGVTAGLVTNSATFSGPQIFNESTQVLVYSGAVYISLLVK